MRNEQAVDQSAPSALTALLTTELPRSRVALIVGDGSLSYSRGRLFPPSQQPTSVISGAKGRIVVQRPTQVGEEGVVIDFSRRTVGEVRHGCRYGEFVLFLVSSVEGL